MDYVIENIVQDDLDEIWEIVCENQWKSYSIEDLYNIFSISPQCCYKLVIEGVLAGAIFGTHDQENLCISFFCVRSNFRTFNSSMNLGIKIIDYARMYAPYTMTYANQKMIQIYKRFGFHEECFITNYRIKYNSERDITLNNIYEAKVDLLEKDPVFSEYIVDHKSFYSFFQYSNAKCYVYKKENQLGYIFYRKDEIETIGPLVADDDEIARELMIYAMKNASECTIFGEEEIVDSLFQTPDFSVEKTMVKVLKMTLGNGKYVHQKTKLVGGHHFIS